MREILFKAKRIDNGEWAKGYLLKDEVTGQYFIHASGNSVNESDKVNEEGCLQFVAFEVDENTICQYTGLTDKNGCKIWEGDVVKCNYNNYGEKGVYVGKVIFREDNCIFVVTNGKNTDYEWWNEEKEVIGNIFDNADLLGG